MFFRIALLLMLGSCLAACDDGQRSEQAVDSQGVTRGTEPVQKDNDTGEAGKTSASGNTESLPDLATDTVAFLLRLGLIRGHLHAGNALYQQGAGEMAATHMKHPKDELYAGLVPAIETRGLSPFDAELTTLAEAVEGGAEAAAVEQAWRSLDEAIESIERGVDTTPREQLMAIAGMLDTAAEEYKIAVFEGMVEDVHEYQDAWGFQQIALQRVGQIEANSEAERSAKAKAAVAVSSLEDLWPDLDPVGPVGGNADRIVAAAERIRAVAEQAG
ncbi:MAG TPA: hypothetical protein VJ908_10720 [Wenzhouxiangellaceae bacterium]|nr:hypothetical protein [Wenzhouxiangellaceae bacterium]